MNPRKTELFLFIRKYKTDDFMDLSLGSVELRLSTEVVYIGVILDQKLDCKRNIEERVK